MKKIYTRSGDSSLTTLASGGTALKTSTIIKLYGGLDELNSFLGLVFEAMRIEGAKLKDEQVLIDSIQRELFTVTDFLSAKDESTAAGAAGIDIDGLILDLERSIDIFTAKSPDIDNFILPRGGEIAARLHVARTVCRRVEILACEACSAGTELQFAKQAKSVAIYLNRLSDLLYVLARFVAAKMGEFIKKR